MPRCDSLDPGCFPWVGTPHAKPTQVPDTARAAGQVQKRRAGSRLESLALIIFLDFDGVMHPFRCGCDRYFCHLGLLEAWLRRRPTLDIVVSSSWREVHPLDEMQSYFSEDLQRRILGVTPIIRPDPWVQYHGEPPPTRFERELEVVRWLHESGETSRPWAALDDQAWLFRSHNPRLVLCDGRVGLTQRELDQVDAVLGIQR